VPYTDLAQLQTELIRKPLSGSAFIAEASAEAIDLSGWTTYSAGPPEVIDLAPLPEGYEDLGYLTDDGMAFSLDTTSSDVTSFQSTQPTRSDITAETATLTVNAQETKLLTLGLYTGATLSSIVADADTGAVSILKPERPSSRYYRVFCLSVDETEDGEIYIGRFMPRAKVTGKAEQQHAKADAALQWGVTFTGYKDSTLGTAEAYVFGGPGWKALLSQMSIETA
jgi:hypothetical protein